MGYLEGLLGGFTGRKREYEAEQLDLARERMDRESSAYRALLSSSDPKVQSLAAAGLLESAAGPKRKGGLSGWIGQMEESTILPQIQSLINTPVLGTEEVAGAPTLPSKSLTGYLATPPPPGGSLAQAPTSPTEGAPMAPLQVDETVTAGVDRTPPSAMRVTEQPSRPTTTTRPVLKPRQIFLSPEAAMLRNKRAAAQGDVEGEVAGLIAAGYTDEQARALVAKKYEKRYGAGGADRSIFGEILQPDGTWKSGSVVFDPQSGAHIDIETGEPVKGFRRNTTVGSTSLGADRESGARQLFKKGAAQLVGDEQEVVNQWVISFSAARAAALVKARGEAAAVIPLSTKDRVGQTNELVDQWTKASVGARDIATQASIMRAALDRYDADPNGASQGVLVTFQKILDRQSVVRESEYARSAYGLSLLDWLDGMRQRYQAGGAGVPKPILDAMVKTAETFVTAQNITSGMENARQRIDATARAYEIDPSLVFGPNAGAGLPTGAVGKTQVGARPPGAQAAPAAGAGVNATVPGVYVDAQGNLVYK